MSSRRRGRGRAMEARGGGLEVEGEEEVDQWVEKKEDKQ
jgi:hypothetical protein